MLLFTIANHRNPVTELNTLPVFKPIVYIRHQRLSRPEEILWRITITVNNKTFTNHARRHSWTDELRSDTDGHATDTPAATFGEATTPQRTERCANICMALKLPWNKVDPEEGIQRRYLTREPLQERWRDTTRYHSLQINPDAVLTCVRSAARLGSALLDSTKFALTRRESAPRSLLAVVSSCKRGQVVSKWNWQSTQLAPVLLM